MDVSNLLAAHATKLQSITVDKDTPLDVDPGFLTVTDPNPIDAESYAANREDYLKTTARDGIQALIAALYALPTTPSPDGSLAQLPAPTTPLPRTKPLQKPKPPTKWERFAASKGIQKKRRKRKVWDEDKQAWVDRWGREGKNKETEGQWIHEVKADAAVDSNPVQDARNAHKARIAKNERQRLQNITRAEAAREDREQRKVDLDRTLASTRISTASMGKFDKKLEGDKDAWCRAKVAKRFGQIACSRFWDGLFPGPNETPAISFGPDGRTGPKYVVSLSGTEMQTGCLGYLTMMKAKGKKGRKRSRGGKPLRVMSPVRLSILFTFIAIMTSFVCCVMCSGCGRYCFSMILLDIISSGVACLVIGSGRITIDTVRQPADGAPPGDGMLLGDDTVVVVKSAEKDVNAITKGRFQVKIAGEPCYNNIGLCSLLLFVQFLLQLLLIPQGSLFGQIMFLGTLGVSWGYNSYLSSLEKEKIQAKVFFRKPGKPKMRKFRLGTRTLIVLACLLVYNGLSSPFGGINPGKILRDFIPNDTQVCAAVEDSSDSADERRRRRVTRLLDMPGGR